MVYGKVAGCEQTEGKVSFGDCCDELTRRDLELAVDQVPCTCQKQGWGVLLHPGVHNAKAEECTTPYMRQNIEINIGVGGLHGNQGY